MTDDEQDEIDRAEGMTDNIADQVHSLGPYRLSPHTLDQGSWDAWQAAMRRNALAEYGSCRTTPGKALGLMRAIGKSGDATEPHVAADDVLRLLVYEMGPEGVEIVKAFDAMGKYYS